MRGVFFSFLVFSFEVFAGPKVVLTVDDLPSHGELPLNQKRTHIAAEMVNVFRKFRIREVYGFMNASKLDSEPDGAEVLKIWRQAGHPLANHTFSHQSLNDISIDEFKLEVQRNEPFLEQINGHLDWKYFRYPYLREGDTLQKRNAIREFLKSRGYKIAQVTIDFEDWSWNSAFARCKNRSDGPAVKWLEKTYLKNAGDMLERAQKIAKVLFNRDIPHILLLHIGGFDSRMLERLVRQYKSAGVEFIPLSEALRDKVYTIDPGIAQKWGSEFTFQVMKSRGLTLKDMGLEPYKDYPEEELNRICK